MVDAIREHETFGTYIDLKDLMENIQYVEIAQVRYRVTGWGGTGSGFHDRTSVTLERVK